MIDPASPATAALLAAFFASGRFERFRPYLQPDPEAAPRFLNLSEPARAVPLAEYVSAAVEGLRRFEAAEEAHREDPDRKRAPSLSKYVPPGLGRLDRFDRETLTALVIDRGGPEGVTLADLRRLDSADPDRALKPGCPNPLHGGTICGAEVPRNSRGRPVHGPQRWNTPVPWSDFGFCSTSCRSTFGDVRTRALRDHLREFILHEAPEVWANLERERARAEMFAAEVGYWRDLFEAATADPEPEEETPSDAFGRLPSTVTETAEEAT